jgi:hypothetical protein
MKDLMKNNDWQRQQNGFTIYATMTKMSCQGINVYTQTSSNFQPPPPPPHLVVVNREKDGGWN